MPSHKKKIKKRIKADNIDNDLLNYIENNAEYVEDATDDINTQSVNKKIKAILRTNPALDAELKTFKEKQRCNLVFAMKYNTDLFNLPYPNLIDDYKTELMLAVKYGMAWLVKELIGRGANVDITHYGRTLIDIAKGSGNLETLELVTKSIQDMKQGEQEKMRLRMSELIKNTTLFIADFRKRHGFFHWPHLRSKILVKHLDHIIQRDDGDNANKACMIVDELNDYLSANSPKYRFHGKDRATIRSLDQHHLLNSNSKRACEDAESLLKLAY